MQQNATRFGSELFQPLTPLNYGISRAQTSTHTTTHSDSTPQKHACGAQQCASSFISAQLSANHVHVLTQIFHFFIFHFLSVILP